MAFDLGTHIKRDVFDDRMIVECFAGNDRLVGLAPRRRGERGRHQLPNSAQRRAADIGDGAFLGDFVFSSRLTLGKTGGDSLDALLNRDPLCGQSLWRHAGQVCQACPQGCPAGEHVFFSRGHDGSIATLGPRQAGDCLTSQPLFVGRILEPAVMDADVVALDILGQDPPVAQANASVGRGDRLDAVGRGPEGGDIFIREKALQLHEPGRHNGQRHREGDKQPD